MNKKLIKKIAWKSLGDIPKFDFIPKVKFINKKNFNYGILHKFSFDNKAGSIVFGYFFMPKNFDKSKKYPAIHYIHWHAGQYSLGKNELLKRKNQNFLLKKLLASGFIVICIDSYCFGERRNKDIEDEELYLAKYNILFGRTLWGMMLRDEILLLNYIKSLKFVDKNRLGITGISMGCTKSLWLSSLFEDYKSTIGLLCTTKIQSLIENKALNLHGIYYYAFGLLKNFDYEVLYSCIKPRSLLLINAEKDVWSPIKGVKYITKHLQEEYKQSSNFKSIIYSNIGHDFTKEMAEETFNWIIKTL